MTDILIGEAKLFIFRMGVIPVFDCPWQGRRGSPLGSYVHSWQRRMPSKSMGKLLGWTSTPLAVSIEAKPQDAIQQEAKRILDRTFALTGTFTPSPAFWGILVGMQLQYNLRELHKKLGRYSNWPYTN